MQKVKFKKKKKKDMLLKWIYTLNYTADHKLQLKTNFILNIRGCSKISLCVPGHRGTRPEVNPSQ